MYLLKLLLNIVVLFAMAFLLFYIYVRTWNEKASVFFKRCAFVLSVLYILGLHFVSFIFINIVVLNILATYSFIKHGRLLNQYKPHAEEAK
nr:MAG TPA: hypothetical protein [Caudoviricetes sp.]